MRGAVSDVQKVLRGVDRNLVVDGRWGPLTSRALQSAPDFVRVGMEKKLMSAGVDVTRIIIPSSDLTLNSIAQKAIAMGVSGPSLVNLLTTFRMESNFQPRRESHVYRDPARAREIFSALRQMSDDQIRTLVASGAYSFFEAVYGAHTRKGKELGNDRPGDGFKYRGNGIIQITGRNLHSLLQKETGVPAGDDPDVLVRDVNASITSGVWYWKRFVVSKGADLDIVKATRVVNLYTKDYEKRVAMARHYSTMSFVA